MPTRRQFLKMGLLGGTVLAAAGGGLWLAGRDVKPYGPEGRAVIRAIAPAVLAGAIPAGGASREAAIASVVEGVGIAIAGLSPPQQKELADLFGLLDLAPARRWLAGVAAPWSECTAEDAAAFLQRWRYSSVGLLAGAYAGLHDLVLGAWYSGEAAWDTIAYPGPPRLP